MELLEHGDMLVDILRHLPPLGLAVSRSVCKAWLAVVDDHRLLRADLLPLSLDGVIYDKNHSNMALFARRPTVNAVTVRMDYISDDPHYADDTGDEVLDCCNGLILLRTLVVGNIATRQWAKLPELRSCSCPWGRPSCHTNGYLAYDPAVSPHYEVLFVPRAPRDLPAAEASATEWPPSRYAIHVFSSETKCWTERPFVRQGDDAPGTVQDVLSCINSDRDLYCAAYWQGSLYLPFVQNGANLVLRLNLTNDKYQIFELPNGCQRCGYRIGKSKKGVYCVTHYPRCKFQIWLLYEESCGTFEWVFKDEINLESISRKYPKTCHEDGPWIMQESDDMDWLLKTDVDLKFINEYNQALAKDDFQWDSDDENAVAVEDCTEKCPRRYELFCLGLHPYKEIVLFHDESDTYSVFAYHLNSSKVRYIGKMNVPATNDDIEVSFPYSPCWTMDLPGSN